jgi:integrase/recombinase XerD
VVWTLLDTGLRVGELCDLTWQQRQLRLKGQVPPDPDQLKDNTVASAT